MFEDGEQGATINSLDREGFTGKAVSDRSFVNYKINTTFYYHSQYRAN